MGCDVREIELGLEVLDKCVLLCFKVLRWDVVLNDEWSVLVVVMVFPPPT